MQKIISLTCLLLLAFSSVFAQETEPEPKPIIFITDASGSMWQKIGPDFKISLAREALGELVQTMPDQQSIGLVAYGHRAKGDCDDIEELLPAENRDKAAFKKALDDLNPLGMTPLARSAKYVIDQLKAESAAASIILITDGVETCDGDLCALVKEAKEAGIDFVMHIIGFDLGDADRAPLECAAEAAGGIYVDASDKDQLADAVRQTSEIRVDDPAGRLSVKAIRNGELIDASIFVYKAGTDEDIAGQRTYASESKNPALLKVPPGTYDVEARIVNHSGIPPIKYENIVVTEEANEQLFDFSSGKISVGVTEMGALHDAAVNIFSRATGKRVAGGRSYKAASSNPLVEELAPGRYDVVIKSVTIKGAEIEKTFEDILVKGTETTELSFDYESAELSVGATKGGALCDATVNIVSKTHRKPVDGGRTYTSASSNPKAFLISPGIYEVTVRGVRVEGDPKETFTVELKAGEKVARIVKW
jgi:Ca-activated chloride channel family protein